MCRTIIENYSRRLQNIRNSIDPNRSAGSKKNTCIILLFPRDFDDLEKLSHEPLKATTCIAFYEMSLMLPNWLQYVIWFWCSAHACSQYIISFSPSLSLSLWAYDLYTSNVIKQLFRSCAYKFFRVFLGRMQKIPQSKFFYRAAWCMGWTMHVAVAFHPSRILDNLAFRRKKLFTNGWGVWASVLGMLIMNHGFDPAQEADECPA